MSVVRLNEQQLLLLEKILEKLDHMSKILNGMQQNFDGMQQNFKKMQESLTQWDAQEDEEEEAIESVEDNVEDSAKEKNNTIEVEEIVHTTISENLHEYCLVWEDQAAEEGVKREAEAEEVEAVPKEIFLSSVLINSFRNPSLFSQPTDLLLRRLFHSPIDIDFDTTRQIDCRLREVSIHSDTILLPLKTRLGGNYMVEFHAFVRLIWHPPWPDSPESITHTLCVEVPMDDIRVGDFVLVLSRETIPIDGRVLSRRSVVDESMLAGESLPMYKEKGLTVSVGTINWDGPLRIETSSTGTNSTISKIFRMVEDAQGCEAPIKRPRSLAHVKGTHAQEPSYKKGPVQYSQSMATPRYIYFVKVAESLKLCNSQEEAFVEIFGHSRDTHHMALYLFVKTSSSSGVKEAQPDLRLKSLVFTGTGHPMHLSQDVQTFRVLVTTWNVGGETPNSDLNLDDILHEEQSDIYIFRLQGIVPLNAGNVLAIENNEPAAKWLTLINQSLNKPSEVASRGLKPTTSLGSSLSFSKYFLEKISKQIVVEEWKPPFLDMAYAVGDEGPVQKKPCFTVEDGNAAGNGYLLLDSEFNVKGRWENLRSSSWAIPAAFTKGFNLQHVFDGLSGRHLHEGSWPGGELSPILDLGNTELLPLEIRFLHDLTKDTRIIGCALTSNMVRILKTQDGPWNHEVAISVKPLKVQNWIRPEMPGLIIDSFISIDGRFLYLVNWLRENTIEIFGKGWRKLYKNCLPQKMMVVF